MPGWGGNTPSWQEVNLSDLTDLVENVASSFPHQKITIVGYSFGGALAVPLALKISKLYKLVLVSAIVSGQELENSRSIKLYRTVRRLKLSNLVKQSIIWRFNRVLKNASYRFEEYHEILPIYQRLTENMDGLTLIKSIEALLTVNNLDLLKRLEEKRTKILVINSRDEAEMFRRQAEKIRYSLRIEFSAYLSGSHNDFVLKPNQKILDMIGIVLT